MSGDTIFNVRVTATRGDLSITAVVDPSILDQKFTTIARTSALLSNNSFALVITPLTSFEHTRAKPMRSKALKTDPKPYRIGDAIREKRCRLGWSQRELAKVLGVSARAIGKWELNIQIPLLTHRIRIETWLNEGNSQTQASKGSLKVLLPIERVPLSELPERMRTKRNEWGMTRKELGDYLGVYYLTIRNWEDGRYTPSAENYDLICEWLEQDITALTERTEW